MSDISLEEYRKMAGTTYYQISKSLQLLKELRRKGRYLIANRTISTQRPETFAYVYFRDPNSFAKVTNNKYETNWKYKHAIDLEDLIMRLEAKRKNYENWMRTSNLRLDPQTALRYGENEIRKTIQGDMEYVKRKTGQEGMTGIGSAYQQMINYRPSSTTSSTYSYSTQPQVQQTQQSQQPQNTYQQYYQKYMQQVQQQQKQISNLMNQISGLNKQLQQSMMDKNKLWNMMRQPFSYRPAFTDYSYLPSENRPYLSGGYEGYSSLGSPQTTTNLLNYAVTSWYYPTPYGITWF